MSVNYIDKTTGDLIRVAGQGKAEYGASTVRKGTFTGTDNGTGLINITVTFDSPMPDADYLVDITDVSSLENFWVSVAAKTKNGFALYLRKSTGGSSITVNGTYTAFKLYTDTEYNNLLNNAVLTSDVTDAVTNGDMNPVTSNAVYDAIADFTPVDAVTNGDMRPVTSNAVYDAITDTNPYHNWTILWTNDGYLDYESEYGDEHAFIAGRIMNSVAYLWIFDDAQNRDLTNVLPAAFRTTAGPFGFAYNSIMHFNVEAWREGDAQGVLKIDAANGRVITQNQLGSYGSVVVSYPL